MKKLQKKSVGNHSVEAYTCMCQSTQCYCVCSCECRGTIESQSNLLSNRSGAAQSSSSSSQSGLSSTVSRG